MQELLYLSRSDVERVGLTMAEIIAAVEAVFLEKGHQKIEMPPKPGIHPQKDAFIHAMPAYVPAMKAAGMKWVSGFPENHAKNLPYINGLLILNDPETGLPIMVSDCAWVTAMRTGAASAVAAKYLARPESKVLGILGCGVQGKSNLEALLIVCPSIERVLAYDVKTEAMDAYRDFAKKLCPDLEVKLVKGPEEAVRTADVVITSGPILKDPTPVIEDDWFRPGAFACPVDFDSYWKGRAMEAADLFATDDVDQLRYYRAQGYFKDAPEPTADLGEIVAGKKPGRTRPEQRIIAMNLGIALEDMAVGVKLYARARERRIGTHLPL
jgi:ornithine cyclodeaminase/alanine dehydrogenase